MIDTTPIIPPTIKWTTYIQEVPYAKQLAALMIDAKELFFGGAAGPGKSSWLLMSALQYVDVPGYAAIIFRKTFADLSQPGALISRSHEWLAGTDAKWNSQKHSWKFPSGAILQFGYMSDYSSRYNYQGAEYTFVGFDECVQIDEDSYKYMFSRLRKPKCGKHSKTAPDPACHECHKRLALSNVPLRMRAASNPPALSQGFWVKERFKVQKVGGIYRGTHPTRAYIPAFIQDNPSIDREEYEQSLMELDPVTRDQLMSGDWGAHIAGRYSPQWFVGRTWSKSPDGHTWLVGSEGLSHRASKMLPNPYNSRFANLPGVHAPPKEPTRVFPEAWHSNDIQWFAMCDPAATSREGPGDKDIFVNKAPSWTVIGLFGLTPKHDLIVADIIRFQKEIPDIIQAAHGAFRRWRKWGLLVQFIGVEANGVGKGVYQQLQRDGLPCVDVSRHTVDKIIYATPSLNRAAQGRIYLPSEDTNCHWLTAFKEEIFGFTGHPKEPNDQVDVLSHAGQYVHARATLAEQQYPGDIDQMIQHWG